MKQFNSTTTVMIRSLLTAAALLVINIASAQTDAKTLRIYNPASGSTGTDSVLLWRSTDSSVRKAPFPAFVNLYNANGTLTGNRTVEVGTNSLRFQNTSTGPFFRILHTATDAQTTLQGRNRANMRWAAGSSVLDIFQDTLSAAQIAVNGTSTALHVGSALGSTAPVHLMVNGANALSAINGGNVGIGVSSSSITNRLHVAAASNPLRLEGLQPVTAKNGTLVADANGVVQLQNASTISAVRVRGSVTLAINNTIYDANVSASPTEDYDNLNEFSGATFTPTKSGLYSIVYSINYDQRASTNDGGDGYLGFAYLNHNGSGYGGASCKVTNLENSGGASFNTCQNSTHIKLTAGDTLIFRVTSFGSTGGVTGNYTINIVRVD